MRHSVKFKVTLWYTSILALFLLLAMGCIFYTSGHYSSDNVKAELLDEVGDLAEDISDRLSLSPGLDISNLYASKDLSAFYDDGIMLSIYDSGGSFVNGILPEHFPVSCTFQENAVREFSKDSDYWFVYDYQYIDSHKKIWWIRGIHSYGEVSRIIHRMLFMLLFLLPLLVGVTALVGYRMVKKALYPIYRITDTVKEISQTSDLSKRLSDTSVQDEFHLLTETFNEMLCRLETAFQSEKQFTSDAAHELRTPVSVIIAHCEYCLEELSPSDEIRREISIIYEKANRMGDLISQLLTMARTENKNYQPDLENLDLGILAESVIEELQEKASAKQIKLILKNELQQSVIQGDMVLLTRLLINLMDNAISYGKEGGYAELTLQNQNGRVCIQVKDNGIGISQEHIDKIWNRFYRADKSRTESGSFGLGLFMVKWIAALHGGTAEVQSTPQTGTIFTVLL